MVSETAVPDAIAPGDDDNRLIDDCLHGNTDAFGRLVGRYQDRLYHALLHVSGSAEEAKDVAQDAFVQAFLKLETFRRTSAFYTWLYRIAFNVAATRRRRARPTVSLERNDEARHELPAAGDLPEHHLEREERASAVRTALGKLPEEFRVVLVMREMDDCDYETIAEVLDVAIGTVRSRLHRARAQMRALLSAEGAGECS